MNIMRGNIKKILIVFIIIIAICLGGLLLLKFMFRIRTFSDIDTYKKSDGETIFEIPEEATDTKFALVDAAAMRKYVYSFNLNENSYDRYIDEIVNLYKIEKTDDDAKYGHWYGMKVADVDRDQPDYPLDNFPIGLPFDEVTDIPIENYDIVLYSPQNTGHRSFGVVVYPATHNVICYDFYSP